MIKRKETAVDRIKESKYVSDLRLNIWDEALFADEELSSLLVSRFPYELDSVPKKYRTKNVCKAALLGQKEPNRSGSEPYIYIPEELWDDELALIATGHWPFALKWIPENLRNKEVCIQAVTQSPSEAKYSPAEYFLDDLFLHRALTESNYDSQFIKYIRCEREEHKKAVIKASFAAINLYGGKAINDIPNDILLDAFRNLYDEAEYTSDPCPVFKTFDTHRQFEAWIRNSGYYKAEVTKIENGLYRIYSRYLGQRIDAYFRVRNDS